MTRWRMRCAQPRVAGDPPAHVIYSELRRFFQLSAFDPLQRLDTASTFSPTATDGSATSGVRTVTITITPPSTDAPVASNDTYNIAAVLFYYCRARRSGQ